MTFKNGLCVKIIFSIEITIVQSFITVLKRFLRFLRFTTPEPPTERYRGEQKKINMALFQKERPVAIKHLAFFSKEAVGSIERGGGNKSHFLKSFLVISNVDSLYINDQWGRLPGVQKSLLL